MFTYKYWFLIMNVRTCGNKILEEMRQNKGSYFKSLRTPVYYGIGTPQD